MPTIKLLTDTASDLSLLQAESAGIDLLCLTLKIGDSTYQEQRELSRDEFLEQLRNSDITAELLPVSVIDFEEAYRRYMLDGYTDIIYVGLCSAASGTFDNAVAARDALHVDYPEAKDRLRIHILDSGSYSMSYGYPLLKAAQMIGEGVHVETILDYLETCLNGVGLYLVPGTTKYLKRSSHLSASAGIAGDLLGLMPLIRISHGGVTVCEKLRPEKQLAARLTETAASAAREGTPYLVLHGTETTELDALVEALTARFGYPPEDVVRAGSALAIHAGHDLYAVTFVEKQA